MVRTPFAGDPNCANPLFLAWTKEYMDQAKYHSKTNAVVAYRKAYDSLKACPIAFEHPDNLRELKGFGPTICARLLKRLQEHCAANGLPVPKKRRVTPEDKAAIAANAPGASSLRNIEADRAADPTGVASGSSSSGRARSNKAYVPTRRTGPYGILMALSAPEMQGGGGYMTKSQIVDLAKEHCDASYTVKAPGTYYTAFHSIKTLESNGCVVSRGRGDTKRWALTDEGWEVATKLRHVVDGPSSTLSSAGDVLNPGGALVDLIPTGTVVKDASSLPDVQPITLEPGSFSVQLVLDNRERVPGQHKYLQDEFAKHSIVPLVRPLPLGDALWVAKVHDKDVLARLGGDAPGTDEAVLDWIVERKRQDDLIGSIKDGRFREQKFRLQKCGLGHVVYMVEEANLDAEVSFRYDDSMRSAIGGTQVTNSFFCRKTHDVNDSVAYLARLTRRLQARYEGRALYVVPTRVLTMQNHLALLRKVAAETPGPGPGSGHLSTERVCVSYPAFASMSSKSDSLTLRDVFLKMLMCTRGITGERAVEIQRVWPTPAAFAAAFERAGHAAAADDSLSLADVGKRKREMVSDELGALPGKARRVTVALSEKLAETWAEP